MWVRRLLLRLVRRGQCGHWNCGSFPHSNLRCLVRLPLLMYTFPHWVHRNTFPPSVAARLLSEFGGRTNCNPGLATFSTGISLCTSTSHKMFPTFENSCWNVLGNVCLFSSTFSNCSGSIHCAMSANENSLSTLARVKLKVTVHSNQQWNAHL